MITYSVEYRPEKGGRLGTSRSLADNYVISRVLPSSSHVVHSDERSASLLGQAAAFSQDHVHMSLGGEERRGHGFCEWPDLPLGRLQRPRE